MVARRRREIPEWPSSVTVEAPASSANLGPGFDALAIALDLWLRVTVSPIDAGAESISVEGEGKDEIGLDAGNRFLIGLEQGMEEFGLEPPVMRIEMSNQIPLARGLGSSAAPMTLIQLLALPKSRVPPCAPENFQMGGVLLNSKSDGTMEVGPQADIPLTPHLFIQPGVFYNPTFFNSNTSNNIKFELNLGIDLGRK